MGTRAGVARRVKWGDIRLRPALALVLTRSSIIPHLSTISVAPVTRSIRGIPPEIPLGIGEGLKDPSVANLDSIQTVSRTRLGRYLGPIAASRKDEVRRALLFAFELEGDATDAK